MKEYEDKAPKIVIGGRCGSFLGEYQARGGSSWVLGIGSEDRCPVGNFCGTGMHGGKIFLRTSHLPPDLPDQVAARQGLPGGERADPPPGGGILRPLRRGAGKPCSKAGISCWTPNSQNPYRQLYVHN